MNIFPYIYNKNIYFNFFQFKQMSWCSSITSLDEVHITHISQYDSQYDSICKPQNILTRCLSGISRTHGQFPFSPYAILNHRHGDDKNLSKYCQVLHFPNTSSPLLYT